jgi:hypothetical protein
MLDVMPEGMLHISEMAFKGWLFMENNEISIHEIHVFRALSGRLGEWLSNRDLAAMMPPTVKPRTVRAKTMKFVVLGLADQAEVFPAHRYRWSERARQRNIAYLQRLERAAEVFGL